MAARAQAPEVIVLVNAVSITEGGSLVVLLRLMEELVRLRRDVAWHVAVGERFPASEALKASGATTWVVPWRGDAVLGAVRWYEWGLPGLLQTTGAHVLFSMTNYLPRRPIGIPTLLLVQHAGHFSALFKELTELRYPAFRARMAWRARSSWVRASVRRASLTVVQTHALADAVVLEAVIASDRVAVVPHGPGLSSVGPPRAYRTSKPWRIGYVTKFGVQKDFSVAFKAVKRLADRGHDVRLVLTLDEGVPEYRWVTDEMARTGAGPLVENLGTVDRGAVQGLLDTLDLFVFPSLCESFGFPMVEAMARGLPTAVADTGSNREIAGSGAVYFDPQDDAMLSARLETLMASKVAYEEASGRGVARVAGLSWHAAARGTMECLDRIAPPPSQARTRQHYDAYPLDFLSAADERRIEARQPGPFREFVENCLLPGQRVADVGCGPGRATMYLAQKGMDVCAVDISGASLALARRRAPTAYYVCATNLALPLPDRAFDAVVSDGVVHHTPDAARSFLENARLVRSGGYMYLGVYRRHRYYYYLYTYLGVPVRWASRRRWGRLLIDATLLPLYFLVHLAKSRGERTWAGARNFLYDYIVTPRATFHTYQEVEGWAGAAGMRVVRYEENVGNVHAFVLRKD